MMKNNSQQQQRQHEEEQNTSSANDDHQERMTTPARRMNAQHRLLVLGSLVGISATEGGRVDGDLHHTSNRRRSAMISSVLPKKEKEKRGGGYNIISVIDEALSIIDDTELVLENECYTGKTFAIQ